MTITNDHTDSFVNFLDYFDVSTKSTENHEIINLMHFWLSLIFDTFWCMCHFSCFDILQSHCMLITRWWLCLLIIFYPLTIIFEWIYFSLFSFFFVDFFSFLRSFSLKFFSSKWLSVDFRWIEEEKMNLCYSVVDLCYFHHNFIRQKWWIIDETNGKLRGK